MIGLVRKIYVTFGGAQYDETTQRIVEDAPRFGVDEVRVYDDKWLMGTEFYKLNKWIFEYAPKGVHRGFGWYCWKPFVILNTILHLECMGFGFTEGPKATVLWTDGDTYPIGDLTPLFDRCHEDGGIMVFAAEGCIQRHWTKRDCMIAMNADAFTESQHVTARFALFEVGNWKAKQLLMEWLTYCLNPLCVGLQPSVLAPEVSDFNEHRSDQSILTNLAHKYGLRTYREADQFGDGTDRDREIFGTVFKQVGQYDKPRSVAGSRFRNV